MSIATFKVGDLNCRLLRFLFDEGTGDMGVVLVVSNAFSKRYNNNKQQKIYGSLQTPGGRPKHDDFCLDMMLYVQYASLYHTYVRTLLYFST